MVPRQEPALGNSRLAAETENCLKVLGEQRLWLMSLDTRENHPWQPPDCQGNHTRPGSDPTRDHPQTEGHETRDGGEVPSRLYLPGTEQGPGTEGAEIKGSGEEGYADRLRTSALPRTSLCDPGQLTSAKSPFLAAKTKNRVGIK